MTLTQPSTTQAVVIPQYSKTRVLGTWAGAALPMGFMAWVAAPIFARFLDGPAAMQRSLILALTAGLFWQFVLVLCVVRREQGTLRWRVLREALWLQAPKSTRTGRRAGRMWWVLLPMTIAFAAEEFFPIVPHPGSHDFGVFLDSHAGRALMTGGPTWPIVVIVMMVLNTALGEELLFRGLLLPRMQGAFGRSDWVANGLLFAVYHLHQPWSVPGAALFDTFALAYPARRYRSAVVSILVHSTQSLFFAIIAATLILR
jgi:membrane protease YdiL (CAAX protease family)